MGIKRPTVNYAPGYPGEENKYGAWYDDQGSA